jgi:hypothetical protein
MNFDFMKAPKSPKGDLKGSLFVIVVFANIVTQTPKHKNDICDEN